MKATIKNAQTENRPKYAENCKRYLLNETEYARTPPTNGPENGSQNRSAGHQLHHQNHQQQRHHYCTNYCNELRFFNLIFFWRPSAFLYIRSFCLSTFFVNIISNASPKERKREKRARLCVSGRELLGTLCGSGQNLDYDYHCHYSACSCLNLSGVLCAGAISAGGWAAFLCQPICDIRTNWG